MNSSPCLRHAQEWTLQDVPVSPISLEAEQGRFRFFCFFFFFFFETGFLCVALAVLELSLQTRLALNSQTSPPLLPPKCWEACTTTLPVTESNIHITHDTDSCLMNTKFCPHFTGKEMLRGYDKQR